MWPNKFDGIKNGKFILREITWILALLDVSFMEMTLLCAIYQYSDDITMIIKSLSLFSALMEVTSNLILCKWKGAYLQVCSHIKEN